MRLFQLRPPRRIDTPRRRQVAGVFVYAAVIWAVGQLPQLAITRWFCSWLD